MTVAECEYESSQRADLATQGDGCRYGSTRRLKARRLVSRHRTTRARVSTGCFSNALVVEKVSGVNKVNTAHTHRRVRRRADLARSFGRRSTNPQLKLFCAALLISSLLLPQILLPQAVQAQDAPKLSVDGAILQTDVPPIVVSQRVLVPLGVLAKYFGVHAQWDQERQTAYLFFADRRQMALSPGTYRVWIWRQADEGADWKLEETVVLDVAPAAVNGRIMVPLGFAMKQMGLAAEWDAQQYMVKITSPWYGKYDPSTTLAADLMPSLDIQSAHADIIALANEITSGLQSDREKLIAIHDWVASNIKYDVEDFLAPPIEKPQDALSVLRRKSGVCSGYSSLTAALLRASGIPARVVGGWARQWNETWADLLQNLPEDLLSDGNHAWNEVFVDGRWIPVDVTWDAGAIDNGVFTPELRRRYLDPRPELFSDDHSKVRPSETPPDPNHYYFKLGEKAQQEMLKLAFSFADKRLSYYPAVGLKDGDQIRAFQLVMIGDTPEKEKTYLLECLRIEGLGWTVRSFTEVPRDYWLPSGGYTYSAIWNQ